MEKIHVCNICGVQSRMNQTHVGKTIKCRKCETRFYVVDFNELPLEIETASAPPIPPPFKGKTQNDGLFDGVFEEFSSIFQDKTKRAKSYIDKNRAWLFEPTFATGVGILLGCLVGFFCAHHFALFGGVNLLGEPYSAARYSLVPGHMFVFAALLGGVGYIKAKHEQKKK